MDPAPPIRLAITVGDPAGIGPEVVAAALAHLPPGVEAQVIGTAHEPGHPSDASARVAWQALETAADLAIRGEVDAVVTGPVCKDHLYRVGFHFPGQTEFFAQRTGTSNFAMCLTGGRLTVALVTVHVPLRDVATSLHTDEIVRVGLLLADHLRTMGLAKPRIAVAGLNPHAGENGQIGDEEIRVIRPAIQALQQHGHAIFAGPFPPDTVFFQAVRGDWDGVLCMYHDQGLIPLKLHAFDEGVNVTLGLPIIRTSPDHGTAFDLAGKGLASPRSMMAAISLATNLARTHRRGPQ